MKAVRYVMSALMLAAVFGMLSLQHSSSYAASSDGARRLAAAQSAALAGFLKPLVPSVSSWRANVRSNTDATGNGQHEPSLAVSPANPNVVVIANKDYRDLNVKRVWIEVSRDGGLTWPTQLHMPGLPTTDTESDPVVMARDDGRIYVSCLTTGNNGVFITWTDDNGLTWQPSVAIVQGQSVLQDKDWFAVDNNPASPYYHRVYMAWAPGGLVSSYSTDGGSTWTAPQQIPNNGTAAIEYPYPVVARNGDVYIFHMYNWSARNPSTSIVKEVKSTDGGATWSQPVSVATILQPASPPRPADQWRFFSIISAAADPTDNNRLYAAWTDDSNHNTNGLDVMYSASTDHGTTWRPATRLSHDPQGVVRDHITPMLDVSADGRLHALWLDRRLDPSNALFQAWYSSSTDGGATWEADTQVSDAPGLGFDLNVGLPPGSNNAAGDYWGLDTAGGYVYTAWTDTRNSNQDIYTSRALQSALTATPTATRTSIPSLTPSSTRTSTPSPTAVPSSTPSSTPANTFTSTSTPTPSSTSTYTPTPSFTPTSTATSTAIPSSTSTPTSTGTPTSTPTPTPAPVLVGHVTWQGRPAQPSTLQQLPITLTLKMGTLEIDYPVQTTDASGFFTAPVSGLPSGTYNWRVKGPKFLADAGSLVLSGAPVTSAEMGLMKAGDADNDNLVGTIDFSILRNSYGKTAGDPGYDDRADFDGNDTVNITDFNLLRGNFGQGGAPPI
jgi:hypothetical protein